MFEKEASLRLAEVFEYNYSAAHPGATYSYLSTYPYLTHSTAQAHHATAARLSLH